MWWAFWDTDERGEQSAEAVCPPLLYCCYCLFRDYKNAVASKHTSSPSLSLPPFSVCRPFSAVLYRLRTLSGTGTTSLLPNWTDQEEWPSLSPLFCLLLRKSWTVLKTEFNNNLLGSCWFFRLNLPPFRSVPFLSYGSEGECKRSDSSVFWQDILPLPPFFLSPFVPSLECCTLVLVVSLYAVLCVKLRIE